MKMNRKQAATELGILLSAFLGFIGAECIPFCLLSFGICGSLIWSYISDEKKNGRW